MSATHIGSTSSGYAFHLTLSEHRRSTTVLKSKSFFIFFFTSQVRPDCTTRERLFPMFNLPSSLAFEYNHHMPNPPELKILDSKNWRDYALLDSGNGQKLEQYGQYRLIRPEAEAVWQPALPLREWESADAVFLPAPEENGGHWAVKNRKIPQRWQMQYRDINFWIAMTSSRHPVSYTHLTLPTIYSV